MNPIVFTAILSVFFQASLIGVTGRHLPWRTTNSLRSQVDKDDPWTRDDEYILSKLYLVPEHQRNNMHKYEDYAIQYYYSMNPNQQSSSMGYTPRGYTTIHQDDLLKNLKCYEMIKDTNGKFNNYLVLPHFPDKKLEIKLSQVAKHCKDQYKNFGMLIVAYVEDKSKEYKTLKDQDMVIMKLPTCSNPVPATVSSEMQDELKKFVAKFQNKVKKGRQYGVFYFGPDLTKDGPGDNFKWSEQGFYEDEFWSAAIPHKQKHSEKTILPTNCDKIPKNGHIYLFTYNSPCIKCAKHIIKFADDCSEQYGSFTVFYYQPWMDCLQSSDFIKNEDLKKYKLTYFQLTEN